MKRLFMMCVAAALAMTTWATNGEVSDGWLTVEDFESSTVGTSLSMYSRTGGTPSGTANVIANPTASTEKVAHFSGGDYNTVIELSITLPTGKTLSDYSDIKFDLYRNSGDGNYKKMRVQADDYVIHYDDNYIQQAAATTWTTKTYSISSTNTVGNSFKLRIGIESNAADYCIDNIKLKVSDSGGGTGGGTGTTTNNVLMVQDFESSTLGSSVSLWNSQGQATSGTATIIANPKASTEKVVNFIGGNYNTYISIPVPLPIGRTLANYSDIKFDFYRNSSDGDYKPLKVWAGSESITSENNGNNVTKETWVTKSYSISSTTAVGNTFNLYIGLYSNDANFCIDNIRLVERTVSATVSAVGVGTFSSDKELDFTDVSNIQAYIVTGSSSLLTLTRVYKVTASTGVLIRGVESGATATTAQTASIPVTSATADAVTDNLLVAQITAGTVAASTSSLYNYILQNQTEGGLGFYKVTSAHSIGANKAYLSTTTSLASSAKCFSFNFDEGTVTGIDSVENEQIDGNTSLYNIAGQLVGKSYKGLVIKNGRKYINK